jgi:hypothetical protein
MKIEVSEAELKMLRIALMRRILRLEASSYTGSAEYLAALERLYDRLVSIPDSLRSNAKPHTSEL